MRNLEDTPRVVSDRPERLATIAEAAVYFGCTTRTINRYVAAGTISRYRIGPRRVRVDLNELDELVTRIGAE